MEVLNMDKIIEMVEINIGSWKPEAVGIIDVNYRVWGEKGIFPKGTLDYYKKFPLSNMQVGDSVHNSNTFLMKITELTGIIIVMNDSHLARLAAINLRGRINALSDFYKLEKFVKKNKKSMFESALKKEEGIW